MNKPKQVPLSFLIDNLDRSEANTESGDLEIFEQAIFGDTIVSWEEQFSKDMQGYWLYRNWCSDQDVGVAVWFYKGELAGVSAQSSRKGGTSVQFATPEIYDTLRSLIYQLREPDQITPEFLDLAQLVNAYQTVHYREQVKVRHEHKHCWVWPYYEHPTMVQAEVVDWHKPWGNPEINPHYKENPNARTSYEAMGRIDVMLPLPTGKFEKVEVEVSELRFPLRLKDNIGVEILPID